MPPVSKNASCIVAGSAKLFAKTQRLESSAELLVARMIAAEREDSGSRGDRCEKFITSLLFLVGTIIRQSSLRRCGVAYRSSPLTVAGAPISVTEFAPARVHSRDPLRRAAMPKTSSILPLTARRGFGLAKMIRGQLSERARLVEITEFIAGDFAKRRPIIQARTRPVPFIRRPIASRQSRPPRMPRISAEDDRR